MVSTLLLAIIVIFNSLIVGAVCPCKRQQQQQQVDKNPDLVSKQFDWNSADKARLTNTKYVYVHETVTTSTPATLLQHVEQKPVTCTPGWKKFKESCYFIEHEHPQTLAQAEKECEKKGATLFVANTEEEFEEVMGQTAMNGFVWTGFYKASETSTATWQTRDGLAVDQMDWLITNPYADNVNGWSTVSQCAAHLRPLTSTTGQYSYWHSCNMLYSFVCERNSTITYLPRFLFY